MVARDSIVAAEIQCAGMMSLSRTVTGMKERQRERPPGDLSYKLCQFDFVN